MIRIIMGIYTAFREPQPILVYGVTAFTIHYYRAKIYDSFFIMSERPHHTNRRPDEE